MTRFQATALRPVASLGTVLEHVRCRRPVLIDRMVSSLTAHGQLAALVAVERSGMLQVLDGFKRLEAAKRMGWPELAVSTAQLDEATQWATMLALNRGPQSMTELDEALILRELVQAGLTQVQIGELVQRHKSWVSRRIGLVERLHPELVEQMKLGMLAPGIARRLLSLPPGNQLQIAAAAQSANLGPRDAELLVSLWLKASEPAARTYLLSQPRAALEKAHPQFCAPDPRLTQQGQQLCRLLGVLSGVAPRVSRLLPPTHADRTLLSKPLQEASEVVCRLATSFGRFASGGSESASGAADAPGSSSS
jgi:ParB-like chromosome segregation protein Spo0J